MKKKGFTLIEILCVLVIIGIIMGISVIIVDKPIKQSEEKILFNSVSNIIKSVSLINIEDEENCFYSFELDNYKLPKEINAIYITLFKENNKITYGVYAEDKNNNAFIDTTDFGNLNVNDKATWISRSKMSTIIKNPNIAFRTFNKLCKVVE